MFATLEEAIEYYDERGCFDVVISADTLHYFSPVSMKPPGSQPAWAARTKRLYTPRGIDPQRFIFAESVP